MKKKSLKSAKWTWLIGGLAFLLSSLVPLIVFIFILSNTFCYADSLFVEQYSFTRCLGFLIGILLGKLTILLPIIFILGVIISPFIYKYGNGKYSFGKVLLWGIILSSILFYLFVYQKLMTMPLSI